MPEMVDGQRVEVRQHTDERWFAGTVIKARKMWVEFDPGTYYGGHDHIADENSIAEWRALDERKDTPNAQ